MGEKRETGLASHANVLLFIYLFIYLRSRQNEIYKHDKETKKGKTKATNRTLTPMFFWYVTGQERVTHYLYKFSWE